MKVPAGINTKPSSIRKYSQIVQTSLTKLCSALLSVTSCPHVAACQWFVSSFVQSVANLCVCANFAITSVTLYSHTLQLFSLLPSASSVAAFVTVQSPNVCSDFSLTSVVCSQVAACQWAVSSLLHSSANVCVCANFSIDSVTLHSHTVQVRSLLPSASSVASFITSHSPNVCSAFSLTSVVCSQVAACQWDVSSLLHSSANVCS